mmetsp:Transcript_30749/g.73233  ORF Transcript_30749/g.73233 Transcript_30749/m.73233 type:complete len:388 (-) Transcript_30749:1830-2993(-)
MASVAHDTSSSSSPVSTWPIITLLFFLVRVLGLETIFFFPPCLICCLTPLRWWRKVDMTRFSSCSFSSSLELDDDPPEDVVEPSSSSELEVDVPFVSRVCSSSELVVDVCDPSELVVDVCEVVLMLSESNVRLLPRLAKLLPRELKLSLWEWKLLRLSEWKLLVLAPRLRSAGFGAPLLTANDARRFLVSSALRLVELSRPIELDDMRILDMFGSELLRADRRSFWSSSNFSRLLRLLSESSWDSSLDSSVVRSAVSSSSVVSSSLFFFFFFFLSFFFFFFLDLALLSRRASDSSSLPTARAAFIPSASRSNSSRLLPIVDSSLSVDEPTVLSDLPDLFFFRLFFFLSFLFLGFSSSSSASLPSSRSLRLLTLISIPGTANELPFLL